MEKLDKLVAATVRMALRELADLGAATDRLSVAEVLEQTAFFAQTRMGRTPGARDAVVARLRELDRAEVGRWLTRFGE